MMTHRACPLFVVDAFAERPFTGNPAAVCLLDAWPDDSWLQSVAAEMNLSETAFVVPRDGAFELRWLTPKVEVDLCGHATLAAACVVWHAGLAGADAPIEFSTRSGVLRASRRDELVELDFPVQAESPAPTPAGIAEALGVVPRYVGKSRFDYLVELDSPAELRAMAPDFRKLATVNARGIIVTSRSDDDAFDFISRFFAPASGIDEDPVTGSAHCTLAPFWSKRLETSQMRAFQASSRGGIVHVRIDGQRVRLAGRGILVVDGSLLARPPAR